MFTNNPFYATLICLFAALNVHAASFTALQSGSWYDPAIWDQGSVPTKLDDVIIGVSTTVTIFDASAACDKLTIDGFLDIGAANLTIGGGDLQMDERAVRNAECLINGRLRVHGDWSHQFIVYGNVKFNTGSSFEMSAGLMMIDGSGFTEALSVSADKPLLDVADVALFASTGGSITLFNPHYHSNGIAIKGAKRFHNISFGDNIAVATLACRNPNDFILSETDKPIFNIVRVAYLPHSSRQNKVIFNNVTMTGNLDITSGTLTGTGRVKIAGNILIGSEGKIETDIECNHTLQQNIATYLSNTTAIIKGNLYINNPDRVLLGINLEIQEGTLQLINGKLDLNEKTLTLSRAVEGGSETAYVLSNNWFQKTGLLLIKNVDGSMVFPVGTADSYVPVTVTGTGDFSIAAKPLLNYNPLGINVQWQINQVSGTSPAQVQIQWNAHNEGVQFKKIRGNAQLHRWENNIWQPVNGLGATSKPNGLIFTKTIQNLSLSNYFTLESSVPPYFITNELQDSTTSEQVRADALNELSPANQAPKMTLYPNPIWNESFINLHLDIDNQLDTKIFIFNINQQLVYQNTFQSVQDLQIPVADLQTGLYSIQILNGGQQFNQKFVKN